MIKGTIYITSDINLCLSNLNVCKTIIVADDIDNYFIPDKIGGSLLLPPYEALAAIIDDDDEKFRYEYLTYLNTNPTVNKFIDIILQALIAGTNIILFIEPEGPNFIMGLKEYFLSSFGILLGDQSNPFEFNPNYIPIILNRLYADDSIDKEYYLKLYPLEIPFDQFTVRKLAYDSGLIFNNDLDTGIHFKKLSKILKNGGLIQGVVKRLE